MTSSTLNNVIADMDKRCPVCGQRRFLRLVELDDDDLPAKWTCYYGEAEGCGWSEK